MFDTIKYITYLIVIIYLIYVGVIFTIALVSKRKLIIQQSAIYTITFSLAYLLYYFKLI